MDTNRHEGKGVVEFLCSTSLLRGYEESAILNEGMVDPSSLALRRDRQGNE